MIDNTSVSAYYLSKLLKIQEEALHRQPEINILSVPLKNKGGRENGRIIVPRRSNFYKRKTRLIDYKRVILPGINGHILKFHKKVNRTVDHASIFYLEGVLLHILRAAKMKLGDKVVNNTKSPQNIGDSASLLNIPSGTVIHNLGARFTRAAGTSTMLVRKDFDQALIKLKSGELRFDNLLITATLGQLGNENWFLKIIKLAGNSRRLGRRPRNRPSARNPVDHPLGGRTKGGSQPKNIKGVITLNRATVKKRKNHIFFSKRQLKLLRQ